MRIIVDTNVVMSGVFFGGVPGRILDAWAEGRLELVLSPDILQEYRRVGAELAARYPELSGALAPALTLIAMNAIRRQVPCGGERRRCARHHLGRSGSARCFGVAECHGALTAPVCRPTLARRLTTDREPSAVCLLLEDGDPTLDAEFIGIQTVAVA